jgi:hypothetical protein
VLLLVAFARRLTAASILAVFVALSPPANAADPLNSRDKTSGSAGAGSEPQTQVTIVPAVGGTTDIGVGIGEFSGITRVRQGVDPFVWNIESAGMVTGKLSDDHRFIVPYGDVYVRLVVPRPSVTVDLRWRFVDHVVGHTAVRYTQNWMNVPAGTKLAADSASGSPEVQSLLGPTSPHGVRPPVEEEADARSSRGRRSRGGARDPGAALRGQGQGVRLRGASCRRRIVSRPGEDAAAGRRRLLR